MDRVHAAIARGLLRLKSSWRWLFFLSASLIILALFLPRAIGHFYKTKGLRSFNQALEDPSIRLYEPDYCQASSYLSPNSAGFIRLAIVDFEKASKVLNSDPVLKTSLARAYCLNGEIEKARQVYQLLTKLTPDHPLTQVELGFTYLASGEEDQAIDLWEKAGVDAEDFLRRGTAYVGEESAAGLFWLSLAKITRPNWWKPPYNEGMIFFEKGDYEAAGVKFAEATSDRPTAREAYYQLGLAHKALGEWPAAIEAFNLGADIHGAVGRSLLYFELGYLYQYDLKPADLQLAWEAYAKALASDDYQPKTWQKAQTYYHRGNLLASESRFQEATIEFNQAITLDPDHYWARLTLASAQWNLGSSMQAIETVQAAITLRPDIMNGYRLLGRFYLEEGNLVEAAAMFQEVLKIDPGNEEALIFFETEK